jgi:hypothetical protein
MSGFESDEEVMGGIEGEEKYDMFVIFNFHGDVSKIPIIPKIVKHDVIQISSELDDYGYFPKETIFDVIIKNKDGSKRAVDIVKHQIRDIETEEFTEMVETETFSEELEKAKTYFLNGKKVSLQECEKIMKKLELHFLVNTPEIKEMILSKINKICHAVSQMKNPHPITRSSKATKSLSIISKVSTESKASIVEKQLEKQLEDLKKFFIKINSNFFAGINLRHRTYKNCFPAWDFEGMHETDNPNYRGILIGAYDGSALDVCFKHIIASDEFKQFIQFDSTKTIDPNLLKEKDYCILRKETLIYGILYFLGKRCFIIDESNEDIDESNEDIDESPHKEDYFELLEELSRNYDELPSEIEDGIPYQTTMININAFIIKLKILAIRYWQTLKRTEWTKWDTYSTYLDGGAMKAHFYGFTCSKLHNITIDTQCGIVRIPTIPRGGSKTRRKKPRNKHNQKSRKRSNSLIRKIKRKPRK